MPLYSQEDAASLINKPVAANLAKNVIFKSKTFDRFVMQERVSDGDINNCLRNAKAR